jgi:hypothetical protein
MRLTGKTDNEVNYRVDDGYTMWSWRICEAFEDRFSRTYQSRRWNMKCVSSFLQISSVWGRAHKRWYTELTRELNLSIQSLLWSRPSMPAHDFNTPGACRGDVRNASMSTKPVRVQRYDLISESRLKFDHFLHQCFAFPDLWRSSPGLILPDHFTCGKR